MQYPIDLWDLLLLKMTAPQVMFVVVLTRTKIIIGWKQTMTKTPQGLKLSVSHFLADGVQRFLPFLYITAVPSYMCYECSVSHSGATGSISLGRLSARSLPDRNRCSAADSGNSLPLPQAQPAPSHPGTSRELTHEIKSEYVQVRGKEIKENPASARRINSLASQSKSGNKVLRLGQHKVAGKVWCDQQHHDNK